MRRGSLALLPIALASCSEPDPARASHERMVRELAAISARAAEENIYFGTGRVERLREQLARAGAGAPWRLRLDHALAELQLGNEARAIELLQALYRDLSGGRTRSDFVANLSVNFYLAVAHLRLSETENCCRAPVPESCILPIREAAVHAEGSPAGQAIFYCQVVLLNTEPTDRWHLSARWLLNLAHMVTGSYPDGVADEYRLPPELFAAGDGPRFENVAIALGLDTFSNAGGVVVDDLDGDGDLDILASDWRPDGALQLYRNEGPGLAFRECAAEAGLAGITGGLNMMQADYDNDGDLDVLVLRGAWWYETGRHPNSLLRNDGDGTFTDVTFLAGLGEVHHPTQAAGWADYDLDGDVDLYIGNEHSERAPSSSQLFRNNGDGTFTDVARAAGVTNTRYAKAVSWGDVDGDRDPDLYVSNANGPNRLYENRGDGTFVDVAGERGVEAPQHGFPAFFFDVDNDGDLDLFASNYDTSIGHIAGHLLGTPLSDDRPRLYLNDGAGGLRDAGAEYGLTYPSMPMGANFGDFDNDGWLDMYLGTGDPDYESLMPNLAYRNDGGRRFVDVTMQTGLGHLQKGHGIAFADIDGDGDQDVFAEMGGAYPGDAFGNALFLNPGHGNRWLTLRLVGTETNRAAIGARIRVVVVEAGEERSIYKHVNSGGSFGASPLRQTIGLGRAERIVRVEVLWPVTGETRTETGFELDSTATITER